MKKIITVLMVLMVATSVFARTKVLFNNKKENRIGFADTSYKEMDFEKLTIEEIISIIDELSKEIKIGECYLEYITNDFTKLDKYAEKYNIYYVVDYNLCWITMFVKIKEDVQLVTYYKIKIK